MELLIRIVKMVYILTGDITRSIGWILYHPIEEFDGLTAKQLVDLDRVDDLFNYLESIGTGFSG